MFLRVSLLLTQKPLVFNDRATQTELGREWGYGWSGKGVHTLRSERDCDGELRCVGGRCNARRRKHIMHLRPAWNPYTIPATVLHTCALHTKLLLYVSTIRRDHEPDCAELCPYAALGTRGRLRVSEPSPES